MILRGLHIALLFAACAGPATAQGWLLGYGDPEEAGWTISGATSIQAAGGSSYPSARIVLGYYGPTFRAGARLRLNEDLNFTFEPGDLIIYVDDPAVTFSEGTRFTARPDRYSISSPVDAFASLRRGRVELAAQASILTQETQVEVPDPQISSDGVYLINWQQAGYRQVRMTGAVVGRYRLRWAQLTAGALALPALRLGDGSFPHAFRPRTSPYFGITADLGATTLGASTDVQGASVSYQHSLPNILRAGGHDITGRIRYQTALEGFSYGAIDAGFEVPIHRYLTGAVGVAHSWTRQTSLQTADFGAWQRTLVPGTGEDLNHSLPHTSVRLGARLHFGRHRQPSPIEMRSIDLLSDHIYSAKREFYSQNPVGYIDLRNTSNRAIRTRIVIETSRSGGTYRSDAFMLPALGERRLPLYIEPGDVADSVSPEQFVVAAEWRDGTEVLTSVPVVTFGRNAWDGEMSSLRNFITPEEPEIRRRAKRLFLDIGAADTTTAAAEERFAHLKAFISALGQGLAYVPDPATSRQMDRVQYPVETLLERGGDCEDLSVYLASSLMAVGIGAAVVAVPASARSAETGGTADRRPEGHVFLLVDTGAQPSEIDALGLNEFQTATRIDARGRSTVWIPIETSALGHGFEAAFTEGVRQYGLAMFGDGAVAGRDVQVLDF